MRIDCNICGYDSGYQKDLDSLMAKVIADGGYMETQYDEDNRPVSSSVRCP